MTGPEATWHGDTQDADLRALAELLDAIMSVPVPPAPPVERGAEVAAGLTLLDIAHRQRHVRRISDTLTLRESSSARKVTEIDISLDLLTPGQRRSCTQLEQLRSISRPTVRGPATTRDTTAPDAVLREAAILVAARTGPWTPEVRDRTRAVAWVPVVRLSRESVASLSVTDGSGRPVPVLTQSETRRLLAAAAARAVVDAMWTLARPVPDSAVARWLVGVAVERLVRQGWAGIPPTRLDEAHGGTGPRGLAADLLQRGAPQLARRLGPILTMAAGENIVVVGLDNDQHEHVLRYETPPLVLGSPRTREEGQLSKRWRHLRAAPAEEPRGRAAGLTRYVAALWEVYARDGWGLLAARLRRLPDASLRPFHVEYLTSVPAAVGSYHAVAECEQSVRIAAMTLITDAKLGWTDALVSDLRDLAAAVGPLSAGHAGTPQTEVFLRQIWVLEAELQRLAHAVHDRLQQWRATLADVRVALERDGDPPPLVREEAEIFACTRRLAEVAAGDRRRPVSGRLPGAPEEPMLLGDEAVTGDLLRGAADEIEQGELLRRMAWDNDPARPRAHVHWIPPEGIAEQRTSVDIVVGMAMVDDDRSNDFQTLFLVFVGALSTSVLSALLIGHWWRARGWSGLPGLEVDALTTILLLAPGFVFSLLSFESTNRLAGRVQAYWQRLAVIGVVVGVAPALALALGLVPPLRELLFLLAALAQFTLAVFSHRRRTTLRAPASGARLPLTSLPAWARGGALQADSAQRDPDTGARSPLTRPNLLLATARDLEFSRARHGGHR